MRGGILYECAVFINVYCLTFVEKITVSEINVE